MHPMRAQAYLPAGRLSATFLLLTFLWWPKKSMNAIRNHMYKKRQLSYRAINHYFLVFFFYLVFLSGSHANFSCA